MTSVQTIRVFALAILAVSLSGAVYVGAALVYDSRVRWRAVAEQTLYRRMVAIKLTGIALLAIDLAARTA